MRRGSLLALSIVVSLAAAAAPSLVRPGDGMVVDGQPTVVLVDAASDAARTALWRQDLDVVDFGAETAEVWVYSAAQLALLEATGLRHTVVDTTDQRAKMVRDRAQEAAAQREVEAGNLPGSALPTGRVEYRTLDTINADMRALALAHPDTAELLTLSEPSLLGREVLGLRIGRPGNATSGKPVYLLSGVHHAREWPTAEFVTEFAHDVLTNDGKDPRITDLVSSSTLLLVPVVNPDGYDVSRRGVDEQKRKNCRVVDGMTPTQAQCDEAYGTGVDVNRNYAPFWGGPGSGSTQAVENYHGVAPLSEPEARNIAELTRTHQVQVAIHNHTPDGRLLRAPSSPEEPVAPAGVAAYDALAQELGGLLDWPAGPWTEIYYVASGVAEQHAFYTAGIYGFTTEATPGHSGLERFHPPYQNVVEQYTGTGRYAQSNLREAFLHAWAAAVEPAQHSVLTGTAPAGATLSISKDVSVFSSCALPGELSSGTRCVVGGVVLPATATTNVRLESTLTVPSDGGFTWHVQPSTRPSQRDGTYLNEAWTVRCTNGPVAVSASVSIARGQTAGLDLSACGG